MKQDDLPKALETAKRLEELNHTITALSRMEDSQIVRFEVTHRDRVPTRIGGGEITVGHLNRSLKLHATDLRRTLIDFGVEVETT